MFGKCASSPGLSLFSVASGFAIHIGIWMIAELIRKHSEGRHRKKTPVAVLRTQLRLNANVVGCSCTFLNILWVALGMLA
jgi:precorrin-4 methylase